MFAGYSGQYRGATFFTFTAPRSLATTSNDVQSWGLSTRTAPQSQADGSTSCPGWTHVGIISGLVFGKPIPLLAYHASFSSRHFQGALQLLFILVLSTGTSGSPKTFATRKQAAGRRHTSLELLLEHLLPDLLQRQDCFVETMSSSHLYEACLKPKD